MFKRVLAFAMAACLVFESAPMTAYAAEPQTETVVEDVTVTTEETPAEGEEGVAEETSAEGEEGVAEETPAEDKEGVAEETPAEGEEGVAEETPAEGEEGVIEETPAEGEEGVIEETPAEGEEGVIEETPAEGEEGVIEETPAEGEEGVTEETPAEGEEGVAEETPVEGEEGVTEETPAEGEEGVTEETPAEGEEGVAEETPVEGEEGVVEETPIVEEVIETVPEDGVEEMVQDASSNEVTELTYGVKTSITLPENSSDQWYSFTAPEAGYYVFHGTNSNASYEADLRTELDGYYIRTEYGYSYQDLILHTEKLEANETAYMSISAYSMVTTLDMVVEKLDSYTLTMQEDGSYTAQTDEYTMAVTLEPGYYHMRGSVSMIPNEGVTLADRYNLTYNYHQVDTQIYPTRDLYMYAGDDSEDYIVNIETGKDYEVYLVVADSASHQIYEVFEIAAPVKTKQANMAVMVHHIDAKENIITIEAEIDNNKQGGRWYYAPTDGSAQEKMKSANSYGWAEYTFYDLQAETNYYFEYVDSDGQTVHYMEVATAASNITASYSASVTTDSNFGLVLNMQADVSGYTGEATYANLYYEYTDIFGRKHSDYIREALVKGETTTFTCTDTSVPLLANTQNPITMWVQFDDSLVLKKEIVNVTTPEATFTADDITVALTDDEEIENYVDYSVGIAGITEATGVSIFYREKGSLSRCNGECATVQPNVVTTGTFVNFKSGRTYEIIFMANGVKKALEYTAAGTSGVKMTQVGEGEVNAFDIVRTFKAESTTEEPLSGTYYLKAYYFAGEGYSGFCDGIALNADNGYEATIKTADYKFLVPETEYQLQFTIEANQYNTSIDDSYCVVYETVKTTKANLVLENTVNLFNRQTYTVALSEDDVRNFTGTQSLGVYTYLKKADATNYRDMDKYAYLTKYNNYSSTIMFFNLEENTAYDVALCDRDSSVTYHTFSFTTPKDERAIVINNITPSLHSLRFDVSLNGLTNEMNGYVLYYLREKTEGAQWECVWDDSYHASYDGRTCQISKYNGVELKDNTTYEYKIGLADNSSVSVDELKKTVSGEISTDKDERSLTNAGASAGYASAKINAQFLNNIYYLNSYVHLFVRAKGDTYWNHETYTYTDDSSENMEWNVESLKAGTTYEYAIVIHDARNLESPDVVNDSQRKVTGEFTTKKGNYTLAFTADDSKITDNKAVVSVVAKDSTEDERLSVTLTLNNGQEQTVVLKQATGYTKEVTFRNLLGETEYTITKAAIRTTENGSSVVISELNCDYKFTTKKAETPTSLTLSEETISLNAAYAGNNFEGYSSKKLKAVAAPATASAEVIWSSSDETIATVTADGTVYAQGVGSAVITATSRYDANVKATCEVTVKNYVIGYVDSTGTINTYDYYASEYICKGKSKEGLGLYEKTADGTLVLLSDFTVIPAKMSVLSWNAGALEAVGVGSTQVTFEKDGVKASMFVIVDVEGKGFGLRNITTSDSRYPAIANEDGSYTLAHFNDVVYYVVGEVTPNDYFNVSNYTWTSSNTAVATVNEYGQITPTGQGSTVLTITVKDDVAHAYAANSVEVTLNVIGLPKSGIQTELYALTNIHSKIGDVPLTNDWADGWEWKYPDTPLINNAVDGDSKYAFEVVYTGTQGYPLETTVNVNIATITGAYTYATTGVWGNILEIANNATLTLKVEPAYMGNISASSYITEIAPVDGLTITPNGNHSYTVAAQKAGTYTLNAAIIADGKTLATRTYTLVAVEEELVHNISFTTDTEGVSIKGNTVIFEKVDDKKDFDLKATVTDSTGKTVETALQWKTTDGAVATVAAGADTHTAKVTAKAEGHTVIMVNAKDVAGCQSVLNVEIRNHAPRVNSAKATVNIAYNYNDYYGKQYASAGGAIEIVPVYGEGIRSVELVDKTTKAPVTNLKIAQYSGYQYLVQPTERKIDTGNFSVLIKVTTTADATYEYPLAVNVFNKEPKVTAKMSVAPNLFFKDTQGRITLNTGGNRVSGVSWIDKSEGSGNGFAVGSIYFSNKQPYFYMTQQDIKMTAGKLQDDNITKGTLMVVLRGYHKVYTFNDFKLKFVYKKPKLATLNASSNIAPSIGIYRGGFNVYDKTNKRYLYFYDSATSNSYYDEVECDVDDITMTTSNGSSNVNYYYTGKNSTEKMTLTFDSLMWREPLQATHTIKAGKPTAYLTSKKMTFNTQEESVSRTYVALKNMYSVGCEDIVVEGTDAKAQQLLTDDLFTVRTLGNEIEFRQNRAEIMNKSFTPGNYKYKVTPYYKNTETGEVTAAKSLSLTVSIIDKAVTAKVTPKGTLDLVHDRSYDNYSYSWLFPKYIVAVNPKFSNWADNYRVVEYELTGEYSDYFTLRSTYAYYNGKYGTLYYISIADRDNLKAGQAYKLAVKYTIANEDGDCFQVTSNTFTIKPKQSKAKVTVTNNGQTLYAAADNVSRSYYLSVPSYYSINSAYGSVDCNKDGKADITVSGGNYVTVRISDKDAVLATEKGKAYNIPVTVKLRGRDGITKDLTTTIKVIVKR